MVPWGTPAVTGYSCEDFPSRITQSRLLLRKEIRPNIWPEFPEDLSLWRRPACQTLQKTLDISSVTARAAPDLLKPLATLSDTPVRRSGVDWEDLTPYWKSENRPPFSRWSTILSFSFSKLFKDFTNYRKKINRVVVFSRRPFPNILKYRDHWWNLPTIWKTRLLKTLIEEFS